MDNCTWLNSDNDKEWDTGCGKSFHVSSGTSPTVIGMTYCPFCGKTIAMGGGTIDVTMYVDPTLRLEIEEGAPIRTGVGWNPELTNPELTKRLDNMVREMGIEALINESSYDYYTFEPKP